ncbi:unnamed protein product, partial [Symbiodinium sp. KB8]
MSRLAVGLAVALVAWVVFAGTAFPGVAGGDSGELLAEACLGGVPHPPGYPLARAWGVGACSLARALCPAPAASHADGGDALGRLASGSCVASTVNQLFAVFPAAAAGLCAMAVAALGEPWAGDAGSVLIGVCAAASLATGRVLWTYAGQAEVFGLHAALVCAIVWALAEFELGRAGWLDRQPFQGPPHRPPRPPAAAAETTTTITAPAEASGRTIQPAVGAAKPRRKPPATSPAPASAAPASAAPGRPPHLRWAHYLAALCALGAANQHPVVFLVVPVAARVAAALWWDGLLTLRNAGALTACGLGTAGAAYASLVWASATPIAGSWGDLSTVSGFARHLLRQEYGTWQLAAGAPEGAAASAAGSQGATRALSPVVAAMAPGVAGRVAAYLLHAAAGGPAGSLAGASWQSAEPHIRAAQAAAARAAGGLANAVQDGAWRREQGQPVAGASLAAPLLLAATVFAVAALVALAGSVLGAAASLACAPKPQPAPSPAEPASSGARPARQPGATGKPQPADASRRAGAALAASGVVACSWVAYVSVFSALANVDPTAPMAHGVLERFWMQADCLVAVLGGAAVAAAVGLLSRTAHALVVGAGCQAAQGSTPRLAPAEGSAPGRTRPQAGAQDAAAGRQVAAAQTGQRERANPSRNALAPAVAAAVASLWAATLFTASPSAAVAAAAADHSLHGSIRSAVSAWLTQGGAVQAGGGTRLETAGFDQMALRLADPTLWPDLRGVWTPEGSASAVVQAGLSEAGAPCAFALRVLGDRLASQGGGSGAALPPAASYMPAASRGLGVCCSGCGAGAPGPPLLATGGAATPAATPAAATAAAAAAAACQEPAESVKALAAAAAAACGAGSGFADGVRAAGRSASGHSPTAPPLAVPTRREQPGLAVQRFAVAALEVLPRGAVALAFTDLAWNAVRATQAAERVRDDVTLVSLQLLPYPWFRRQAHLYRGFTAPALAPSRVSTDPADPRFLSFLAAVLAANRAAAEGPGGLFVEMQGVPERLLGPGNRLVALPPLAGRAGPTSAVAHLVPHGLWWRVLVVEVRAADSRASGGEWLALRSTNWRGSSADASALLAWRASPWFAPLSTHGPSTWEHAVAVMAASSIYQAGVAALSDALDTVAVAPGVLLGKGGLPPDRRRALRDAEGRWRSLHAPLDTAVGSPLGPAVPVLSAERASGRAQRPEPGRGWAVTSGRLASHSSPSTGKAAARARGLAAATLRSLVRSLRLLRAHAALDEWVAASGISRQSAAKNTALAAARVVTALRPLNQHSGVGEELAGPPDSPLWQAAAPGAIASAEKAAFPRGFVAEHAASGRDIARYIALWPDDPQTAAFEPLVRVLVRNAASGLG